MRVLAAIAFFGLASCTTMSDYGGYVTPSATKVFLSPQVAASTIIFKGPTPETVYWANLKEEERRDLYNGSSSEFQVEIANQGGGFTILPAAVTVDKGSYRLRYRYQMYRETPCKPEEPSAGNVRVGVGLEIVANIRSKKNNLVVSDLVPVAGAVYDEKMAGTLSINVIGAGATSGLLSNYLTNGTELDLKSVTRAMEAMAVMQALLEDKELKTIPSHLELIESSPGSCRNAPNVPSSVSSTAST